MGIAILFLRNQVRPIERLARAADWKQPPDEGTGQVDREPVEGGGELLPAATHEGTGLGLTNVCQRLEARWGSRASCRFGPIPAGGYKVALTMPVETHG